MEIKLLEGMVVDWFLLASMLSSYEIGAGSRKLTIRLIRSEKNCLPDYGQPFGVRIGTTKLY
jgi:hypothetical protein